jgi:hypothetical protein
MALLRSLREIEMRQDGVRQRHSTAFIYCSGVSSAIIFLSATGVTSRFGGKGQLILLSNIISSVRA